MLITAAPAPDGAGDRARGVRAEDLLPVRQRHVERPRARARCRACRRRWRARRRPSRSPCRGSRVSGRAAERRDVRRRRSPGGRVDRRCRRARSAGSSGVDGGRRPRRRRRSRASARCADSGSGAGAWRCGDPVRLGVVEQPARAQGGGERAGALAGDLPGAAGDPPGAGARAIRSPAARSPRAGRSRSPGRRRRRPRRPSPGSVTPGARRACRRAPAAAAVGASGQRRERRERRGQGPCVHPPQGRTPSASDGLGAHRADERRRGPVALLAVLLATAPAASPAPRRGRSTSPQASGPRGWLRPSCMPASMSAALPTPSPSAKHASLTSWPGSAR